VAGSLIDLVICKVINDQENACRSQPAAHEPKMWTLLNCFDCFQLPDLPMHGLAHGIIPYVTEIMHTVFAHYKKFTAFVAFGNKTLINVASFRLDHCKVKLAFTRLFSYLYGMLSNTPLITHNDAAT